VLIGSGLGVQTLAGSRGHVRLPVTALVASSVITVAGCGGGTSLPHSLPPLHSAIPPTSPEPSSNTKATSPANVVRRYYAALNNLHVRMDPASFGRLFSPGCPCQAQVRAVLRAQRKGLHYIDRVHLIKLTTTHDSQRVADVLVSFNAAVGGLVVSTGRHVTSAPPALDVHRDFVLLRDHGRWKIERIEVV
jgi:hypothetical protein